MTNSTTVEEFAERHRISRVTVYQEINAGRLQTYKIGKCRRISARAEADWLAAREAESATNPLVA